MLYFIVAQTEATIVQIRAETGVIVSSANLAPINSTNGPVLSTNFDSYKMQYFM